MPVRWQTSKLAKDNAFLRKVPSQSCQAIQQESFAPIEAECANFAILSGEKALVATFDGSQ
jgi:hypothetical protein